MNADEGDPAKSKARYQRIVLKLSGEVLHRPGTDDPIDEEILETLCRDLKAIFEMGVQICLVVGGGNIFRGKIGERRRVQRTTGDFMGMLATAINGLAFMDCLERMGVPVRVQSAVHMHEVAEPFILRRAVRHLEKGRLVVFVGGTGNPYFSTDSAAALRASEIDAEVMMKATKVDGVYDKDPMKYEDARKLDDLTYLQAMQQRLEVMDSTAFSLCRDNQIPILVFSIREPGSIVRAVRGDAIGTFIHS